MTRTGINQIGQFEVQTGMVFTMPEMINLHPKGIEINANSHPWIITNNYNDYIEVVMCTTLSSTTEKKHRYNQLNQDNKTDILQPCPPMDRPEIRTSSVSLDTAMLLKKQDLFSNTLKIWNNNTPNCNFTTHKEKSLCLQKPDITNLQNELREYQHNHKETPFDPDCCEEQEAFLYDLEDGLPVPKGFTKESYNKQFGWQHIKPANPYAVYPFEDQMYDYEKQDPELVKIARLKKQAIQKQKRKQQADDKFGHIQTNSPDTELGLGE